MSNEYIPVATTSTIYYKPETQQEFDELVQTAKVGDMIFSKSYLHVDQRSRRYTPRRGGFHQRVAGRVKGNGGRDECF